MATTTPRSAEARDGHVATPRLSTAPSSPPLGAVLSPGSHCLRCQQQDDASDDVIRELVPEIGQRRTREEAARDRRFALAGVTESELRLMDGNR